MTEAEKLEELIARWEHRARRLFYSAERETNPMGKRLLEHGAMCYFNCATELREARTVLSPAPLATPAGD